MSQNTRYYKIYNYKEIYSEFKSHLKKKINEDSTVNNYIKLNMKKYSDDELLIMSESTLKHKDRITFDATIGVAALTAIFTLFAILVAISSDTIKYDSRWLIIFILCIYVLMILWMVTHSFRKYTQVIRTANLLDIAIRLRKNKI
jgi:hypothetical protein